MRPVSLKLYKQRRSKHQKELDRLYKGMSDKEQAILIEAAEESPSTSAALYKN